jgi:ribosomal protein L23
MDLVQKQQIAQSVKDFFNSLPKEVIEAHYEAETKSVLIKFKKQEAKKKSLVELFQELEELLAKAALKQKKDKEFLDSARKNAAILKGDIPVDLKDFFDKLMNS